MNNSFEFEEFKAQAIEKLKAGVPLSDKDGVLAPLLKNLQNSALKEKWTVIKNKSVFTYDTTLKKLFYLTFTRIWKKWTQPVQNWGADSPATGYPVSGQVQDHILAIFLELSVLLSATEFSS